MKYFLLFLISNIVFAMDALSIKSAWTDIEKAFVNEIVERQESIHFEFVEDSITFAAAITHKLPRKLYVSKNLLKIEGLKKEHLYNIFCHELGHILGGAPFIEEYPGDSRRISTEGQADYFATAKCMKRLMKESDYEYTYIPVYASENLIDRGCETRMCQLISYFSYETIAIFGSNHDFDFDRFDSNTVDYTHSYNNSTQCRLDTFIAGAICPVSEKLNFTNESQEVNACHWRSFDTYFTLGSRPSCWFRPFSLGSNY